LADYCSTMTDSKRSTINVGSEKDVNKLRQHAATQDVDSKESTVATKMEDIQSKLKLQYRLLEHFEATKLWKSPLFYYDWNHAIEKASRPLSTEKIRINMPIINEEFEKLSMDRFHEYDEVKILKEKSHTRYFMSQDLSGFEAEKPITLFGEKVTPIAAYRGAGLQSYYPDKLVRLGYRVYLVDIFQEQFASYDFSNGTWYKAHNVFEPTEEPTREIVIVTIPGLHSARKNGSLQQHTKFIFFAFS
jgi:hypothetical protein